jgi:ATP-dependent Clp protease ATP-binding subunit ClpC
MAQPATIDRVGGELSILRRHAEDLARQRKESTTTCHLLAAVALQPGPIRDLLQERQLTADGILGTAAPSPETRSNCVERAFTKARELSHRMGIAEPTAAHLLMAILSDASAAGRRVVERLNIDVARLRSQAWNLSIGWPSRKLGAFRTALPAMQHGSVDSANPRQSPERRKAPAGVTIPLFPPNDAASPRGKKRLPGKAQCLPIMPERPQKAAVRARPHPASGVPDTNIDPTTGANAVTSGSDRASNLGGSDPLAEVRNEQTVVGRAPLKKQRRSHERFELDPKRFAVLTRVGTNLTLEAAQNRLDEVLGRDYEMDQTLDVLAKRQGNSPCLVGPSGVGKTSIVRGLALRIARRETTTSLDDRIIVEIPVSELLAGTGVRGALSQRIAALRNEVRQAEGKVVVFFDEIHLLFAGDAADESAGELKLALSRGEFPCIGATTAEGYRRCIESDPALARRFAAIDIEEPSPEKAYLVLESTAHKLALHHRVRYSEEALALGISWSVRYLPGRTLPEKAISIADLAGARARRRGQGEVTPLHIAEVVSDMASIPIERLLETDAQRMLSLERLVGECVVGHQPEIHRICNVLRRNAVGLGADRPIGTFLLLGPTGVGKTETAKALAHALFHSEAAMTRLDMAEYTESHAVARLIGAPPGYVGHDAGGQLTESVRKRPYQVLLLDEIEKAHHDVLQSFLAVFDEGRLTDGKGRTVDFRNTIILMTSNLGAEHTQAKPKRRVGFAGEGKTESFDCEAAVLASARAHLSPELYNRIDEFLVFAALSRSEVKEIARRLIGRLGQSLSDRGISIRVSETALDYLMEQGGFDLYLGARPMKRTIARLIEANLAERLLSGNVKRGSTIAIDVEGDALSIREHEACGAAEGAIISSP